MPETTCCVFVSTDLGGDPDDIQSLVHLLHYSDILRVEGIVSTTGPGSTPRASLIREWVRRVDLDRLRARGYPEPDLYPNYYTDLDEPAQVCQATINRWRVAYLQDWKARWQRYG